jgi:alanine racemase
LYSISNIERRISNFEVQVELKNFRIYKSKIQSFENFDIRYSAFDIRNSTTPVPYTISTIQFILNARWYQQANAVDPVEVLLTDSRQLAASRRTLFFALTGLRHDGHDFLPALYRAGVRCFIVGREVPLDDLPDANVLLVDEPLAALQALAAHHRARFDLPVAGITGSNGKTVVKEWLYQLLHRDFNIVRSPKSYNSQIGVPLSVWQLQVQHTLALFEAGISRTGEMERLGSIIRPTIGIFTNIGAAHREGFASKRDKVYEKMRLFDHTRLLIYCRDYALIEEAAAAWRAVLPERHVFTWSMLGEPADLQITAVEALSGSLTRITGELAAYEAPVSVEIGFTDAASVQNAIHCWAVLHVLGLPHQRIRNRMRRLEPVEMRLELKAAVNRCMLINDAYNSDLVSLGIALQFAAHQNRFGPLTLVLSDILQTGAPLDKLYRQVAEHVREHQVARFIGIGADVPAIAPHLPEDIEAAFFPDTAAFLQNWQRFNFHDELILLKGARPFEFERIARRLEQKAHKTILEVSLSAVVHNLRTYTQLLHPGTRVLVMVKASGYGSGSAQVAKLLEFHKVDYLGVAYADEGIELRQAGVTLPILVLNPEPASFDALYRFRLEPEVYSLALLDELINFAGRDRALAVHVKLDTGMHRLGFEPGDIEALTARLRAYPNLRVESVFSHLTSSDSPRHDEFTRRQAAEFTAMYEPLRAALGYAPLRHLVNTGGIVRFPEYHFDMVRLGVGLYGVDSSGLQEKLQVVLTLKATVSQIKELQAGESVGYNRNGVVTRASRIATISIGYADGFLRLAGNGRYSVALHGRRVPTIGNVCMDMTMVDVTDLPQAREGDEVIVFGETPPVQELAQALQTIPYEVFTNISERVKRVYWQE